jgi:hypothetical protein
MAFFAWASPAAARDIDAGAWASPTQTLSVRDGRLSVPLPATIRAEIETRLLRELTFRFDDGCEVAGQLAVDGRELQDFAVPAKGKKVGLSAKAAVGTHTVELELAPGADCGRGRTVIESATLREWIPIGTDVREEYLDDRKYADHASTGSYPSRDEMVENFRRFADLGLAIQITEADVADDTDDPNSPERRERQSDAFAAAAKACKQVVACDRFTMWGLSDKYSWLGEKKAPLPFDGKLKSKPSWGTLKDVLRPKG